MHRARVLTDMRSDALPYTCLSFRAQAAPSVRGRTRKAAQAATAVQNPTPMMVEIPQASGIANAKMRAKALWQELKRLLKAGKFAAVQARELWSTEEQVHMRPGHFWACVLGDADGKGSPILFGPFVKQQHWPPTEGEEGWKEEFRSLTRQRYDAGDCALLVRCYYHRTPDDREGLTFVRWQARPGETLVITSSELRAVQDRQECDIKLTPPRGAPQLRQQLRAPRSRKRQMFRSVTQNNAGGSSGSWMASLARCVRQRSQAPSSPSSSVNYVRHNFTV